MTTDEFEALIQGADESVALEFKGPMLWAVNSLVKDILAMANIIDGGHIVFGIEDMTNTRLGLTEEQDSSFNLDIMRDQVAAVCRSCSGFSDSSRNWRRRFEVRSDPSRVISRNSGYLQD